MKKMKKVIKDRKIIFIYQYDLNKGKIVFTVIIFFFFRVSEKLNFKS